MIRKELGLQLTNALNLLSSKDAITTRKTEVVNLIQKLDDIIGIRIVTELKQDCLQVYDLLRNSVDVFIKNEIKFENLEGQPEKMRNGLDIFRLKGTFQNLYGFELQIKSKIDETWGDLDHTLFYKDYSISPIKDTVQITMNNVAHLLDKIERLLFDLRESGDNYNINAEQIQIRKELEDELSPLLRAKFGVTYNLKEIAFYLRYLRNSLNINQHRLTNLNFDYLEIIVESDFIKRYTELRNNSFVLIILECIYLNWFILTGIQINSENYEAIINNYVFLLSKFISKDIPGEDEAIFFERLKTNIECKSSPEILLNPTKHLTAQAISNRINEILSDFLNNDELQGHINVLFQIELFNGDTQTYINTIRGNGYSLNNELITIKDELKPLEGSIDNKIIPLLTSILEKIAQ